MKYILTILFIIGFVFIAKIAISKEEKVECYKLQAQAEKYQNMFITVDENEMCFSHNIIINSRVQ